MVWGAVGLALLLIDEVGAELGGSAGGYFGLPLVECVAVAVPEFSAEVEVLQHGFLLAGFDQFLGEAHVGAEGIELG